MGRGRGGMRGRGRGGGGGRGRGGFRGRGQGRGRGRGSSTSISRKDSDHLRQFGESHPADAMGDFKNPSKKFKPSSDETNGRAGTHRSGSLNTFHRTQQESSEDESDDSDEEEVTPYQELLSIFTGHHKGKAPVQIVSESEEESEGDAVQESENEEDNDDDSIGLSDAKVKVRPNEIDDMDQSSNSEDEHDVEGEEDADVRDDQDDNLEESNIVDETVIDEAESDSEEEIDTPGSLDPFITHFQRELGPELQSILATNKPYERRLNLDWPILDKIQYTGLRPSNSKENDSTDVSTQFLHTDSKIISTPPSCPVTDPGNPTLESMHLKIQMHKTIPVVNQKFIDLTSPLESLTPLQKELLLLATAYQDVYFSQRSNENEDQVRIAYCIHAANHILKTRARIVHHNSKMKNKIEVPEEYRDQGFVRPKVLILTPFKETALRIVKTLISLVLIDEKGNVQNKKRFVDEYSGETLFLPKTNPKPDDYMAMFSGNVDDNFKIGLAITKKSIKLYTGFYASDVIVASPVGLRMLVGAEGERDRDYDFLSSIEILIMDQADVFLMQNWDHLLHLIRHLHLQPVTTHGTDFARIRPWALDNLTKYYCQTLMFSSLICPEHLAFFSRYARNYAGFAKIINPILTSHVSQIHIQLPQVFQQFDCGSIAEASEARFEHFLNKVLPNFKGKLMSHTMIFVSSYFDYVRLRNYLRKEEQSFVQICEYTKDKKIARARDLFFHGKNKFLLYTERAHFFRRFRLKGIGHIIFYQLPQYPHFYSELCNYMQESFQNRRVRQRKNCSVNVIYCKYDATRLASLVGTERANHMLSSDKPTHAFVTEAI